MDVQDIAKRIGMTNVAVVRKAQEFVRLSKVRCPQGLGAVWKEFVLKLMQRNVVKS